MTLTQVMAKNGRMRTAVGIYQYTKKADTKALAEQVIISILRDDYRMSVDEIADIWQEVVRG